MPANNYTLTTTQYYSQIPNHIDFGLPAPIRFFGGTNKPSGANPSYLTMGDGSVYNETACQSLDFNYDGTAVDFIVIQGQYRVFVDGAEITQAATPNSDPINNPVLQLPFQPVFGPSTIHLDFGGVAALRHIQLDGQGLTITEIAIEPGRNVTAPTAALGPRMIVMGDSFTEGTGTDGPLDSWAVQLGHALGIKDVWPSGAGGTGYLNTNQGSGRVAFGQRFDSDVLAFAPDIIVFAGGINDNPGINGAWTKDALQSACTTLFQHAAASLPGCKLYALGPWRPPPARVQENEDARLAIQAAVAAVPGMKFVDVSSFFTGTGNTSAPKGDGNADQYISPDNTHPSPAGHHYLAQSVAALVPELTYPPLPVTTVLTDASVTADVQAALAPVLTDLTEISVTLADIKVALTTMDTLLTQTGIKVAALPPSPAGYGYAGLLPADLAAIASALEGIVIEPGETLPETPRLLRAILAGDSSASGTTVTYARADGTTVALTVTVSAVAGTRTGSVAGTLS